MCNATKKLLPIFAVAAMTFTAIGSLSCDSAAKRGKASCDSMVNVAKNLIDQRKFVEAFQVMDSVDKRFPQQIEARREITRMRSQAMVDYSQQQLTSTDSLIAVLEVQIDDMTQKFQHVAGSDIAGYYVPKAMYNPAFLSGEGIEARVDDDDMSFYIVAVNNRNHIGINCLEFQTNSGPILSGAIAADSDRSGDLDPNGIDMASFLSEEVSQILDLMCSQPEAFSSVTLIGKNGARIPVRLTTNQVNALADAWKFSNMLLKIQQARLLHNKLEQQLIIARDHTVNLE